MTAEPLELLKLPPAWVSGAPSLFLYHLRTLFACSSRRRARRLTATQRADSVLRFPYLRHQTKSGAAAIASKRVNQAPSWLDTPWHYATVGYRGQQLGLLVETDDEKEARREAEELCTRFGGQA